MVKGLLSALVFNKWFFLMFLFTNSQITLALSNPRDVLE